MADPIARHPIGHTNVQVSTLGIGAGSLANAGGEESFARMVDAAWNAGLRHFDTAALYLGGESERRLGRALRHRPRDEFVVSTKAGRYQAEHGSRFDYSRDGFLRSVEESVERLGLGRVDVVMIHDLDRHQHAERYEALLGEATSGAAVALLELKAQGVIGAVGIACMDWRACLDLARRVPVDCIMLAGGYTPLQRGSGELLEHCVAQGVSILAASPFNAGILATGAIEGARYAYGPASPEMMERTRRIEAVCRDWGVELRAVALQFALRHRAVASVVAGHLTAAEVAENLALMRSDIPDGLWHDLDGIAEPPAAGLAASR